MFFRTFKVSHAVLGGPALAFPLRALLCLCAETGVYAAIYLRNHTTCACVHTCSQCVHISLPGLCAQVLSTLRPDSVKGVFCFRIHNTFGSFHICSPCVHVSTPCFCAKVLSTLQPDIVNALLSTCLAILVAVTISVHIELFAYSH